MHTAQIKTLTERQWWWPTTSKSYIDQAVSWPEARRRIFLWLPLKGWAYCLAVSLNQILLQPKDPIASVIRLPISDLRAAVDSPYTPYCEKDSNWKQAPSALYLWPGFSWSWFFMLLGHKIYFKNSQHSSSYRLKHWLEILIQYLVYCDWP